MNLRVLLNRCISVVLLSLFAPYCWAYPVELIRLTGAVGWSCGTGTGGFESGCQPNVEQGRFDLIYDPLIPDSDSRNEVGLFRGAITYFTMTVSQTTRPDLLFSLVGRGDIYRGFTSAGGEGMSWHITLSEDRNTFPISLFTFGMYFSGWAENVNEVPTTENLWQRQVTGLVASGAGVSETDWLYPGSLVASSIARPVPIPSTLWLCLVGAGMMLVRQNIGRTT